MTAENIVLCGFMGCGKSTVGRLLAAGLTRPFLDTDAVIEQETGLTIPQLFAQNGEADFRAREREVCRRLAMPQGRVVAVGGGTLMDSGNTAALRAGGVVVHLYVPIDILLDRLQGDTHRPLLARPDWRQAARDLYARRLPLYRAAADAEIDARGPAKAVADAVQTAVGTVLTMRQSHQA